MKKTALLLSLLGLLSAPARAQTVPLFVTYQGKVTDSAGVGLGTGTPINRKVLFRLYDATTGGNRIWTEEQTVTLSNGEFSVLLGQGVVSGAEARPALDTVFTSPGSGRYLGVTVDNGDGAFNGADVEITPRQQITTTAYAFRALSADTIASGTDLKLNNSANYGLGYYGSSRPFGGLNLDGPVLYGASGGVLGSVNGATQAAALRWDSAGRIGIGITSPTAKLHVRGGKEQVRIESDGGQPFAGITTKSLNNVSWSAGSYNNDWQIQDDTGGATRFAVTRAGNVGIGFDVPAAKLAVNGTSYLNGNVGIGQVTPATALDVNGVLQVYARHNRVAPPSNGGDGGDGTRMILWPADASNPPHAIGVENSHIWNVVPSFGGFKWYGGATQRMVLNSAGNLGIGTATPSARLTVDGSIDVHGKNVLHLGVGVEGGKEVNSGKIGYKTFTTGLDIVGAGTASNGSDRKVTVFADGGTVFTGPVGIGMAANTAITGAKLVVDGFANFVVTGPGSSLGVPGTGAPYGASGYTGSPSIPTSIRATDRIVCPVFSTSSDLRMKNRVGLSDGEKDLRVLMGVEVTDYTFKDTIGLGSVPQKKVIAQQLQEVMPQAVIAGIGVIPDIYKSASVRDGWVTLDCGLKQGDLVRLNAEGQDGVFEVLEAGQGTFRTSFKPTGGKVFVYGRQVTDFLTVDYDAVAMLNVSATQQIKREKDAEVKALQEENSALRGQLEAVRKQVTALAEQDKARDAKLAAIERLLGEKAAFPVSVSAPAPLR